MSAINVPFNISADEKIVPLDRWGYPAYTVQIVSGAPVIEGATARINRGDTPTWVALNDQSGTPISGTGSYSVQDTTPLEAIRVTGTGAGRITQTGA